MAHIIEFHIPGTYQPKPKPVVVSITPGKVIEFPNDSNPAIRRIQLLRDCLVLSRAIGSEKNF